MTRQTPQGNRGLHDSSLADDGQTASEPAPSTPPVTTSGPDTDDAMTRSEEREPITGENLPSATAGPELSEEKHEVILTEERVVVAKETVPVERVRLGKEVVTEDQKIDTDVRKEQIELDADEELNS